MNLSEDQKRITILAPLAIARLMTKLGLMPEQSLLAMCVAAKEELDREGLEPLAPGEGIPRRKQATRRLEGAHSRALGTDGGK